MFKLFKDFAVKFNANAFKIQPDNPEISIPKVIFKFCKNDAKFYKLEPGSSKQTKIPVNFNGASDNQPPGFPFKVQAALKTNVDVFIFFIPCSLSVLLV